MASSQRTIVFTTNHLSVRGTDVSMYDYPHYAETLLGYRSLVVSPSDLVRTFQPEPGDYDCYSRRFNPGTVMRQFEEVFLLRH